MEIHITNEAQIEEISIAAFNVSEIDKVKSLKGGAYRQDSKAPTFCSYVPRHLDDDGKKPGLVRRESQGR